MTIKNGDKVQIISGEDKGKTGKVTKVLPKDNKIIVEGVNINVKHQKQRTQQQAGGRIEKEVAIYADKAQIVCKSCGKATRIGYKVLENGKKVRVCKKCQKQID